MREVRFFVPFPTPRTISPEAIGSSVQLCPTLSWKWVLMIFTTSKLEIPVGLWQARSIVIREEIKQWLWDYSEKACFFKDLGWISVEICYSWMECALWLYWCDEEKILDFGGCFCFLCVGLWDFCFWLDKKLKSEFRFWFFWMRKVRKQACFNDCWWRYYAVQRDWVVGEERRIWA